MDTRNFFNLPLFYQYGIGSAGFNIWREVLMHKISTEWVLNKENTNFPLMYDYRIIKHIPNFQSLTGKFLSEYIGYWNNSKAILSRILENDNSRYEVIMFLEYIPMTLSNFLDIKLAQNEELQIDQIIEMLEEQLMSIFSFLNSKGIVHFDPHFENILTDGKSLYLTDFGLVLSKDFLLDSDEIRFLENHKSYDKIYILMELVNTIIYDLYIKPKSKITKKEFLLAYGSLLYSLLDSEDFFYYISLYASKSTSQGIPRVSNCLSEVLKDYSYVAFKMNEFLSYIRKNRTKNHIYPTHEFEELLKHIKFRHCRTNRMQIK